MWFYTPQSVNNFLIANLTSYCISLPSLLLMIWVLWPLTVKQDPRETMRELGVPDCIPWDEDIDVTARIWLQTVRINKLPEEDRYILPAKPLHDINVSARRLVD